MPKVLFIDSVHPLMREELTAHGFQCDYFQEYGKDDFMRIIGDYDGVIIRSKIKMDREILGRGCKLRFIGRVGAGMENIDLEYARSRNIYCLNSPEGNRDAVGEHTLGMLLSLMNHLNRADREVRQGIWKREENRGIEIKGKTVAILGYGNMGAAFARRLQGFEANVISYDKYKFGYSDGNTRETDLKEILESADIFSLHVPLSDETFHLANDSFFQMFRKPIFLINTSRGGVVNTGDLVKNLKTGKVRGAALDVLEYEDMSFEKLSANLPEDFQYLMKAGNVVLSPHIAGWTVESEFKLARVLIDKILQQFTV